MDSIYHSHPPFNPRPARVAPLCSTCALLEPKNSTKDNEIEIQNLEEFMAAVTAKIKDKNSRATGTWFTNALTAILEDIVRPNCWKSQVLYAIC